MIDHLKPEEQHQHKNGGGWVANTATVAESAYVGLNAQVYGDAQVFGSAQVYGDAQVFGGAWEKSPLYIQGTRHAITNCAYGKLAIGCEVHTFVEWKKNFKSIGRSNNYSDAEIKEYGAHIAYAMRVGRK